MKPSVVFEQHRSEIREIVAKHHARNARVFGSVLHGKDNGNSDLDLLVDITDETSLFDIGAIQFEISELLKIKVDVLTPGALPEQWKTNVLNEAQAV